MMNIDYNILYHSIAIFVPMAFCLIYFFFKMEERCKKGWWDPKKRLEEVE